MGGKGRRSLKNNKLICVQCKLQIQEEDDFIECDKCTKKYHSQCTHLDKRQFEFLLSNESEAFTCHVCEGGQGGIKNELNVIKTKLNKLDQLTEIQEAIHFMSKQYDEILKGVAENKKRLTEVEKENRSLKKEVKDLKASVKLLNDVRVKKDCIVSGLKVDDNATAVEAVLKLSDSVGVDMVAENIEEAYFLGKKGSSTGKKSVVVKFSTKSSKDKLMSAKPKLKENADTSKVFVNDFLSKETLNLLNYARTLKDVGYNHIYARGGRVFYKRSDISKPQVIKCEEDVDTLLLSASSNKPWKRRSMANKEDVEITEVDSSDDDDGEKESYVSP